MSEKGVDTRVTETHLLFYHTVSSCTPISVFTNWANPSGLMLPFTLISSTVEGYTTYTPVSSASHSLKKRLMPPFL